MFFYFILIFLSCLYLGMFLLRAREKRFSDSVLFMKSIRYTELLLNTANVMSLCIIKST